MNDNAGLANARDLERFRALTDDQRLRVLGLVANLRGTRPLEQCWSDALDLMEYRDSTD
jgi:hypothetical protein